MICCETGGPGAYMSSIPSEWWKKIRWKHWPLHVQMSIKPVLCKFNNMPINLKKSHAKAECTNSSRALYFPNLARTLCFCNLLDRSKVFALTYKEQTREFFFLSEDNWHFIKPVIYRFFQLRQTIFWCLNAAFYQPCMGTSSSLITGPGLYFDLHLAGFGNSNFTKFSRQLFSGVWSAICLNW